MKKDISKPEEIEPYKPYKRKEKCLNCNKYFNSASKINRICSICKSKHTEQEEEFKVTL